MEDIMKKVDGRTVEKLEIVCPCGITFQVSKKRFESGRGKRCSKECQYKYATRASGLSYNITKENKGWFKEGQNCIEKKTVQEFKICGKCKSIKPCAEFYETSRGDGFRWACIECSSKYKASKESNRKSAQKRRAVKVNQLGVVPDDYWEILVSIYGEQCLSCGTTDKLELDHVIPISFGTSNTKLHDISNFQILCRSCNAKKKDKYIEFRKVRYIHE